MFPAWLTAKAIQLCAAGLGVPGAPLPLQYAIAVHAGAVLTRQPSNLADAEATVRDLITLGADFEAGPLAIKGQDFATFGVTAASVFDACALVRVDQGSNIAVAHPAPGTVSGVTALLRQSFGARITDTIRPMNATYGARYSWHKFGQAIDFVPVGGVGSITREQIRAMMSAAGVHLIELLGPGDPGHANHWHIAFARPGQVIDQVRPVEDAEDWLIDVANADFSHQPVPATDAPVAPASGRPAERAPASWDVFAAAEWRASHGGTS